MMEWKPFGTEPKDGKRIRVAHEKDPSSFREKTMFPVIGYWDGDEWVANALFTCVDGFLRTVPTHWTEDDAPPPSPPPRGEGELDEG